MTVPTYRVRRATVEDLPTLKPMWTSMNLPVADLERRLTEFQTVEAPDGKVAGAIGFQIVEKQGRLHSEAFSDFAVAETARPLVWERIQVLASNHGIFRVWTRENAPYWKQLGFQSAEGDVLKKLPAAWASADPGWLTMQLKNEEMIVSLEKEMALFMESEKQRTAKAFQHARVLKMIATFMAIGLAIFVAIALLQLMKHNGGFLPRAK